MVKEETTMKKMVGILILVFLAMFGMNPWAMAQNDVQSQINMFKDVSSRGQTYGISFELSNDVLKKVTRADIWGPRGARIWVNNTLDLNGIFLSSVNLSLMNSIAGSPRGIIELRSLHHLEI